MNTPNKILIPVDRSTFSLVGVQYGEEIADHFNAEVVIVAVQDSEGQSHAFSDTTTQSNEARAEHKHNIVLAIQQLLINHNLVLRSLKIEVRYGSPAVEIVRAAEDLHADLIVMSTHGRTGMSHVLLGSVAERVVRYAKCPVLTVKPDEIRDLIDITAEEIANSLHVVVEEA
ncbi:MAG TPA: universal stress protein [Bacteroidota bacterium]